jgi:hypothetical protein
MNKIGIILIFLCLITLLACDTSSNVAPRNLDYFIKYHGGPGEQSSEQFLQTYNWH